MPNADATPLPTAEASLVVREPDLASVLAMGVDEAFPAVFATARMIALMEIAAARCLVPLHQPGELSVGVGVDVEHLAPTPLGARVTARATYLGPEGKLHRFEVVAHDDAGEIGRGLHTRAVVETRRIVEGAKRRARPLG
jgi:fluoroacetyl-CoA thioesterase